MLPTSTMDAKSSSRVSGRCRSLGTFCSSRRSEALPPFGRREEQIDEASIGADLSVPALVERGGQPGGHFPARVRCLLKLFKL